MHVFVFSKHFIPAWLLRIQSLSWEYNLEEAPVHFKHHTLIHTCISQLFILTNPATARFLGGERKTRELRGDKYSVEINMRIDEEVDRRSCSPYEV